MDANKRLEHVSARHSATGEQVSGYEMHIGTTDGADRARNFATVDGENEGAISADGLIEGTYLHGLFSSDRFRSAYLEQLGTPAGNLDYHLSVETTLDELADHLEGAVDLDLLLDIAQ